MNEITEQIVPHDLIRGARAAGRKIAAIGGGTGLSTLLLGLKEYTDNITAIVTVTDDGGGSGVLRDEFGILPPGDIRNCLLALANTSESLGMLINYRFPEGSLKGQSFGNLFLLALNGIYGSFEAAVARMNDFLAVTGKVLPVTTKDIQITAKFEDGSRIVGETAITQKKIESGLSIKQVALSPRRAKALPEVVAAIEEADVILLGPGSLYTSVIPNLLVDGVSDAICKSKALKIYILNIMTQDGETEGFSAAQHMRALQKHGGRKIADVCLYNTDRVNRNVLAKYAGKSTRQLWPDAKQFEDLGTKLVGESILARDANLARHDPLRLAYAVMKTANELAPRENNLRVHDKLLLEQDEIAPGAKNKPKYAESGIE